MRGLSQHDLTLPVMKVGDNAVYRRMPEQSPCYKQNSLSICVNSKRMLVSYVCIMYLLSKLEFCFLSVFLNCPFNPSSSLAQIIERILYCYNFYLFG
jgi:hypothetical protein